VLGIAINLPRLKRATASKDDIGVDLGVDPALLLRLWDPATMEDYHPFPLPSLEVVPGSFIEYFKNGVSMGIAFQNLYHGIVY
jgi:hypothetical protein